MAAGNCSLSSSFPRSSSACLGVSSRLSPPVSTLLLPVEVSLAADFREKTHSQGCRLHHPQSRSTRSRSLVRASTATKPPKSPAEEDWKVKRDYLLKNQVRSVNVQEAYKLHKEDGYAILDVRPEGDFKQMHPEGAINAQVYRLIKEWTAWDIARRAAFAFFGIFAGTEENPEFLSEVRSKLDKDAKIIVACSVGGTMKPSANLADGQQSRSLIAAYLLKLDGFKAIVHLEGGLRTWFKEGLPTSSEE